MPHISYPGKWVILGEHSVLRGGKAIASSLSNFKFEVKYNFNSKIIIHSNQIELSQAFQMIFEKLTLDYTSIGIEAELNSNIPVASGLGSSAALCLAAVDIFHSAGIIPNSEIFNIAKKLENTFHGTSSGMDIAAIKNRGPIIFQNGFAEKIQSNWRPYFTLSSTQEKSSTKICIEKVVSNPDLKKIDLRMQEAVSLALHAFSQQNISDLKKSVQMGQECFEEWGLLSENAKQIGNNLLKEGALAFKPTGSGGGGFLIALWDKQPPEKYTQILY